MFQALKNISVVAVFGLVVCLLALSTRPAAAQDYLIGSQDVLKITVFEHPDLTVEARVGEEGKITFPLIGEVMAKNLTTRQVEQSIASRLSAGRIIKKPQVSVFVESYKGSKVTVIGEVVKPGQYEIAGPTTVLDVISLALGTTQNAGYEVTVFRKEKTAGGKEITRKLPVDIDRLLNGADLKQNVELQNGDVVNVPKAVFYVYGEVNRPGAYRMERGITVKRAIALAGGLTPKGSLKRMEITRRESDKDKTAGAGIDDMVRIDDVVRIKESIF